MVFLRTFSVTSLRVDFCVKGTRVENEEGKRTLAYNFYFGRAPDIAVDLANNTEVEVGKDIPATPTNLANILFKNPLIATPTKLGANILKYRIIDEALSPCKKDLAKEHKKVDQELNNF